MALRLRRGTPCGARSATGCRSARGCAALVRDLPRRSSSTVACAARRPQVGGRAGTPARGGGSIAPVPVRARIDHVALDILLRDQDRVATHAQLVAMGLAPGTFSRRTAKGGPWRRLLPGVVLTHAGAPRPQEIARAALLYAGPDAILTGVEALRRAGASHGRDGTVDVLVPHDRRRASTGFVRVERTRRLPAERLLGGLPCAPVARALVDACRRIDDLDAVRSLVAPCVQRRACTLRDLVLEVAAAQRRGTRHLRTVLHEVSDGVRSVAEAQARTLLGQHGVPAAQWNVDLLGPDGQFVAAPDAWWDGPGVALEVNSQEWHVTPASWHDDQRRWRQLVALGVLVVPVTPRQLRETPVDVVRQLLDTLDAGARRPRPPVVARMGTQRAA